jgi:hypothetical protein
MIRVVRVNRVRLLPRIPIPVNRLKSLGRSHRLQRGKAATELREAFGVRGACSRFRTAPRLATAPASWTRSPNASRGSSSTRTFAACEHIGVKQCKDAKRHGFRLLGTFTRWVSHLNLFLPPHPPAPCVLASWRLCVNCRFPATESPTGRLCPLNKRLPTRRTQAGYFPCAVDGFGTILPLMVAIGHRKPIRHNQRHKHSPRHNLA